MSSRTKNGFTLIELLASMAVLSLIVLLVGRIMADSTAAYKAGTARAEMNDSGRAIFDFIVQDISAAIADSQVVFNVEDTYSIPSAPAGEIYGRTSTQLRFVSMNNEPNSTTRGVNEVIYRIREMTRKGPGNVDVTIPDRYQLMRSEMDDLDDISCYTDPTWWDGDKGNNNSNFEVVAENVAHFTVYAYATNYNGAALGGVTDVASFISTLHEGGSLPLFIDVYMELLDEKDAILVAATQDDVRARKQAKRYQARIYFKNRSGYSG